MIINLISIERSLTSQLISKIPVEFELWRGEIEESKIVLSYLKQMPKEIMKNKHISINFENKDVEQLTNIILGNETIVY